MNNVEDRLIAIGEAGNAIMYELFSDSDNGGGGGNDFGAGSLGR